MEAARQLVSLLWNWVDLALDSGWQFFESAHDQSTCMCLGLGWVPRGPLGNLKSEPAPGGASH